MGSIGDCYDKGQMESFWARMKVELLNRQRWSTRLELANAMFEYLEIFHNRERRHSLLGMLSPIEYERRHADDPTRDRASCRRDTQGTREQSPIPGRFTVLLRAGHCTGFLQAIGPPETVFIPNR
jgi:hypothetical protein